jgi:glycosyltransferase involved in cell wall biosynthesis
MALLRNEPLVSVVIPCYNQAKFLPTLFGSLLAQTYSKVEVIFLDDCSSDSSWETAQAYRKELDTRFVHTIFERNPQNIGTLKNLARGFAMVSGDYISQLEAQHYYCRNKVERNLEFFELHPDFGVVHSDYNRVTEDLTIHQRFASRSICDREPIPSGWISDRLLRENVVCAPTLMVKRELYPRAFRFELFERRNYGMADYPGLLVLAQLTKIGFLDEPLVFYRQSGSGISDHPMPAETTQMRNTIFSIKRDLRLGELAPGAASD